MEKTTSGFRSSVTGRLLLMKFASEFILIYPLYTIMFGEMGVSAAGIGAILATGFVLAVIFEIPTGVIADKVPRKYVLIAAIVSKILALGAWLALPFFWGFMFAAALFALGSALESGALQAYLYGTLGDESKKSFGRFWARVSAMVMFSYTIAYILASAIGVNYPVLIILSIAACVFALFVCLSLPRDSLVTTKTEVKTKIFKTAVAHIRQSRRLLQLLAGAVIVVGLAEVVIEFITLYYYQVGVEARYVPLLMAFGNIFGGLLFWTLHSWERFLDRHKLLLTIGMTALFVASFAGGVVVACAGILLFTRFIRVLQVQFESGVQHLSNEETRATISSIGSFGAKLGAAAIVALVGLFAVDNNIVNPLRMALLIGVCLFVIVQLVIRHNGRN